MFLVDNTWKASLIEIKRDPVRLYFTSYRSGLIYGAGGVKVNMTKTEKYSCSVTLFELTSNWEMGNGKDIITESINLMRSYNKSFCMGRVLEDDA